jgi:PIN domain nuclease of toxin-antitoxin system
MNILLDTHTLIWLLEGDNNLSENARKAIENPANTCVVSIASLWEIAIKINIGKLTMKMPYQALSQLVWENGIEILPIHFKHTLGLLAMPLHHRDPFDRILLAQAITEKMAIVSRDENFYLYEVQVIW